MPSEARIIIKPLAPFDFELSARIFSDGDPQIRKYENGVFWQLMTVGGKLLLTKITAAGSVDAPRLVVELASNSEISRRDREEARKAVCTLFNLSFDLKRFYGQLRKESTMALLTRKLKGLKSPTTPTAFEALVDSIVEQQISLDLANKMENRLIKAFGETLVLATKTYYAFPTPQRLATTRIRQLRQCGLSQRKAEYIRDISRMIVDGKLNLEKLKECSRPDDILKELDAIRGIGIWTAELTMIRGMQRLEAFPADDVGLRRVISHYFSGDRKISSDEARKIADNWGTWKGLAGFYLIMDNLRG